MVEMVELSVQVSEFMNYEIKIPKNINEKSFPEIMKRLRAIYGMLPQEVGSKVPSKRVGRKQMSPVLTLSIEESKKVFEKYKRFTPDEMLEYLKNEFGVEPKLREHVVSLMHRLKKRIYNLESYRK